jgi:hypothetical protein
MASLATGGLLSEPAHEDLVEGRSWSVAAHTTSSATAETSVAAAMVSMTWSQESSLGRQRTPLWVRPSIAAQKAREMALQHHSHLVQHRLQDVIQHPPDGQGHQQQQRATVVIGEHRRGGLRSLQCGEGCVR